MKNWIAALALGFASQAANAQVSGVQIRDIVVFGTGCPQGSVQVVMAPDASAFTVLYDRFQLQVAPGAPEGMIHCEVQIAIKKPLMKGFGIESADFRGFVHLEPGVTAEQKVEVSAGPIPELRKIMADFGAQQFQGPVSQNYVLTTVRPLKLDILDCVPPRENTKIVIKSKIRLNQHGGPGMGQMSVDTADGRMAQHYRLKWQNCAKGIGGVIGGILGGIKK